MTCFRLDNGQTLNSYCVEHDIPYNLVYRRLEMGQSIEDSIEGAKKAHNDVHYNRKHFYKGHYVGDLLGGWNSVLYRRFLAENRRTHNLEKSLAKYIDITKVVPQ